MVLAMGKGMDLSMGMGEWRHGNRNGHANPIPPTGMLVFYFEIG